MSPIFPARDRHSCGRVQTRAQAARWVRRGRRPRARSARAGSVGLVRHARLRLGTMRLALVVIGRVGPGLLGLGRGAGLMGTLRGTARKECGAGDLLDGAQLLDLVRRAERDGDAVGAVAAGAADAVDVALGLVGQVVVDDVA